MQILTENRYLCNMLRELIDFLVPAECSLCGSGLPHGVEVLCPLCAAGLQRTGHQNVSDNPMEMRFAGIFPFDRAVGFFHYSPDAPISFLIHDFKYRGIQPTARYLGRLMAEELMISGFFDDVDFLMPVPLHWLKHMRRGYNQSEEIAVGVSKVTGIPVSTDLRATKSHRTQTGISATGRRENVEGIFRLRHPERYGGKKIILIDDVCTTGATLTAAAEALLSASSTSRLSLLALAITSR